MKDKNWMKSPWTIGIGTAIFAAILNFILNNYFKTPMLSAIWQILKGIWNFAISVLNFNLKVWWVIVAIIAIFVVIYLVAYLKPEKAFRPDFCNYTEEKFKRWRWSWNWKWNNWENAWCISDLTAYCPNCDTKLTENPNYRLRFDCPRCDLSATDIECDDPHKIQRIILDNIEREKRNTK
jgi:hypothetical protein